MRRLPSNILSNAGGAGTGDGGSSGLPSAGVRKDKSLNGFRNLLNLLINHLLEGISVTTGSGQTKSIRRFTYNQLEKIQTNQLIPGCICRRVLSKFVLELRIEDPNIIFISYATSYATSRTYILTRTNTRGK